MQKPFSEKEQKHGHQIQRPFHADLSTQLTKMCQGEVFMKLIMKTPVDTSGFLGSLVILCSYWLGGVSTTAFLYIVFKSFSGGSSFIQQATQQKFTPDTTSDAGRSPPFTMKAALNICVKNGYTRTKLSSFFTIIVTTPLPWLKRWNPDKRPVIHWVLRAEVGPALSGVVAVMMRGSNDCDCTAERWDRKV